MSNEHAKAKTDDMTVAGSDILFECPACGKSLVVDEAAEGMIVDCPQCRTNVIVPPKSDTATVAAATTAKGESKVAKEKEPASAEASPRSRLAVLTGQLREIQAQRTEVTSRIAARLNEVNRDLLVLARLETSQQQILAEWNQVAAKAGDVDSSKPTVLGASTTASGRTRVTFQG